jgi:C-terminal processing protease CtpA/Prc
LYRYWNIIQYLYPYKNLFKENWNDVLSEFLPKFINTTGELDYKLTVLALIARIHDTHANIWGNDETLQAYKGANYAPINVKFVENQAIVTGFIKTKSGNAPELQKGDIIVRVNNKSLDKIIQEKLSITPASNYSTQLRDIARDLLRTNDSVLNITYKRGNSIFPLTLKCYSPKNINVYENYYKKDTCFKLITPEIGYIYPGTIKNNYLSKIMSEVQKTKGLIIDLRCYPSEFIVFSLGEYLMPDSISFVKFSNTSLNTPGLFTYTKALIVGKSNKEYFKGKVIILVNEITQSQAEYTTMALRVAPNATVLGSTTAGADGNVSQFTLPGWINTMISGIGVYYPDGKETQRIGMIPDIVIKPTIKGIKQDRDELIEKAIELINKK